MRIEDVQPENSTDKTAEDQASAPVQEAPAQRRDINDPKATFEDLPFKPQLTEKQAKRANQTFKGMILSIGFSILIFLPLYLLNPHPKEEAFESDVDVQATAQQLEADLDIDFFAPEFSDGEYANFARWNTNSAQGVPFWEFGYVLSKHDFVWVRQAPEANETWIALTTDTAAPAGERTIGDTTWDVRTKDETTYLIAEHDGSTFVLSSDTGDDDLERVAKLVDKS